MLPVVPDPGRFQPKLLSLVVHALRTCLVLFHVSDASSHTHSVVHIEALSVTGNEWYDFNGEMNSP